MNKYLTVFMLLPLAFTQAAQAEPERGPKGDKPHYFLKLFDGNGDGAVTEAEFNSAMQQRYQEMDGDQNGTVSLDEFKRYSAERHKNWQQKRHHRMDRDQDGAISKKEFIDRAIKRAERRFDKLDKNQDGMLTQEEHIEKHSMKKQQLLEKMDKNQDGQISREEHAEMTQRWFEKMDANNDKVVSGDELKGWRHRN